MLRHALVMVAALGFTAASSHAQSKPNVLIITVDDMNCDSMGTYGCPLPDTTPNMDALARSALRFQYAHVQVGNCMPSRNVMWSGRYPHNNGVEGFYQVPDASYPVLCSLAKQAGYFTAIRHKISHSTPYSPYAWDLELDDLPNGGREDVKNAKSYGRSTRRAIAAARDADQPFCAMINVSDPHKPFYTQVKTGTDPNVPSLIFEPSQVIVPGFLPDDVSVRAELALYYSSVRRADDCVGEILKALEESGLAEETFVLFLSDHGMPLPFAKTQLYHHSTRTPLMVRWPGVTQPNSVDSKHMVSAVDFIPTLVDVMQLELPSQLDGRSFASLLKGAAQPNRDFVVKEYNENSGAKRNPMRGIQTKDYLYLFNPWSNGELPMATATNGTITWKRMKEMAAEDSEVAARVNLMQYRVPEELYKVSEDPDCLFNLIDDPNHRPAAADLQELLLREMQASSDPLAEVFVMRADKQALAAYMQQVQAEADDRRKQRNDAKQAKSSQARSRAQPDGKRRRLFSLAGAEWLSSQRRLQVTIKYSIPESLSPQDMFITLKSAANKRIERKQLRVKGAGASEVVFELPATVNVTDLRLAAFVGADFQSNLQYLQTRVSDLSKRAVEVP